MKLTEEQGNQLLSIARIAIKSLFVKEKIDVPISLHELLSEKRGIFVTLKIHGELRGCIGFPQPIYPLGVGIIQAAVSAAVSDPRFEPLQKNELKDLKIEITVLTKPELIKVNKPTELPKKIKIGRDGLIVQSHAHFGLLLPQVAVEHKWSSKEFLNQTCIKAGLPANAWLNKDTKIYCFQGQVFAED